MSDDRNWRIVAQEVRPDDLRLLAESCRHERVGHVGKVDRLPWGLAMNSRQQGRAACVMRDAMDYDGKPRKEES